MRTTRFWNNLHEMRSNRKVGKPNNLKVLGESKLRGPKQDHQNQQWSAMSEGGGP